MKSLWVLFVVVFALTSAFFYWSGIDRAEAAPPTFVACGTPSGSTGAITPALPAGIAANDILLLFIETDAQAIAVANQNGGTWAEVTNSPQNAGSTTRLTVFWSRYNGTQGNPTTSDSGDHQVGAICAYRGIETNGNPWDVTTGDVDTTSDTSGSIPGATTTGPDRLVVIVGAADDDNDLPISSTANADLANISAARVDAQTAQGNDGGFTVFDGQKAAAGAYGATSLTYPSATTKGMMTIALKPPVTMLGNGTDPSNAAIAPGAAATDLDSFTLQTTSGSDTVTAATVTLAAGSSGGLSLVAITNNAGTTTYCSQSNPVSDAVSLTSCGIPVSTTQTQFKIRITPKSHANMPAPPGSTYSVTGRITAFTSTNSQSGSDTSSATVTIDNQSPANVSGASGTAGNQQVSLSWTNPGDSDFHSVIVLRRAGTATSDTPAEGATYTTGNTIGSSVVACIEASPATNCVDTGLTNGTAYHYRVYTRDSNVNYSATGVVPTGSPFTPAVPADVTAPSAVSDLATGSVTSSTIALSWTAPGDDGSSGTATIYDVRYSTSNITESNFSSAAQVSGEPTPSPTGSSESMTVTGLSSNTTYYFALKTSDEVPNTSALSNVSSGTTSAAPTPPPPPPPPAGVPAPSPTGGQEPSYAKATFSGIAFPYGVVEIAMRNRLDPPTKAFTVATSTTEDDGSFGIALAELIKGDYLFTLRVRDKLGRDSGVLGYSVDFIFGKESFEDTAIFTPPTLGFRNAAIVRGEMLEINGYAAPGNKVEITSNGIIKKQAIADKDGLYSLSIDTHELEQGEYFMKARQIDAKGRASAYSPSRLLKIAALAIPEADLNNDSVVNISDWSIFLFRWGSNDAKVRATIDLNKNGIVDISDLSVFLNTIQLSR